MKQYWVYIASNAPRTLYTGVTSNLRVRMHQHRNKLTPGFTSKYRIDRLEYFESTSEVKVAIARGKQIKSWRREKKLQLIESMNPRFRDLSEEWE